jgi:hypothetical protein
VCGTNGAADSGSDISGKREGCRLGGWQDDTHPVKCLTDTLRVSGAYLKIAQKIYIRATDFPSPAFDAALERCRGNRAWRAIEMKCGNDIMVDQPAELAEILGGLG